MKLTAAHLALAMVLAALLHQWIGFHPLWWGVPLCGGGLWFMRFRRLGGALGLLGVCMLWIAWREMPAPNSLSRQIPRQPAALDVRLEIAGDAVIDNERVRVPVWVRSVRYHPEWQPTYARVQMRLQGIPETRLVPGTQWEVHGRLDPQDLAHTGLHRADWVLQAQARDLKPLESRNNRSVRRTFYQARERLSRRLAYVTQADPEAGEVLQALLLARRGDVDDLWTRRFARTGMLHLFAVSGLHLGILASMLIRVGRRCGVSYRWQSLLVLPVLFAFTACTGFRAGTLRALIMTGCLISAPLCYRRPNAKTALFLSVAMILGAAPRQLGDIGFQFSFLMVAGLLALAGLMDRRLETWLAGDPWATEDIQWPWWKRRLLRPFLGMFVVSAICFVLAAPLTARTFHLFSPVALPGNALAVPMAVLLLAAGFPALFFLVFPASIAAWAFLPARWAARSMLTWVAFLDEVPAGVWWVRGPATWQMWMVYGLPALLWWRPRWWRPLLAIGLMGAGFSLVRFGENLSRAELVVVDGGRGQAAWVRNGTAGAVMVDTGDDWQGWHVRNTLQSEGVNRIPALFLTHPHRNHIEGMDAIMATHPPERIFVAEPDLKHPLYEGLNPIPLAAGDRVQVGKWEVDVLWPPAGHRARALGERSLVLRFSDGFAAVLFMGGANERVEAALLAENHVLPSRILVAGNSPRIPGCTPEFLQAAGFEAAVFSGMGFQGIAEARDLSESRAGMSGLGVWRVPENHHLRFDLQKGTALNP